MQAWISLIAIALGLAMDAFATSIVDGLRYQHSKKRHGVYVALTFGIFQGAITLLAGLIEPLMTEVALANLSGVGNVLIFAIGVNLLLPDKKISVANFLPALIVACLWS